MADRFWKLEESSIFSTDVKSIKIIYHSNLNIILVLTKNGEILVIDVTSGMELHKSVLSGKYVYHFHTLFLSRNNANVADRKATVCRYICSDCSVKRVEYDLVYGSGDF